jgi:hypothetical protein
MTGSIGAATARLFLEEGAKVMPGRRHERVGAAGQ